MSCSVHAPVDELIKPSKTERAIESASIIGAKHIVVEGIETPTPHASRLNFENNYKFYKKLEPLCEKFNIIIAIENLKKSFTYPDLLNDIIKKLNSPWFKVCFDVGHSWVRADMQPADFIRQLDLGVLCGLHVHDTHGIRNGIDEHLLPGMAEIDFDDLFCALREVGYNGDMTLEVGVGFMRKYAPKGLLLPALKFCEAVGRKLIEDFKGNYR